MSDELLPYYEEELNFIRSMGAEFARQHPKIAERLRLRDNKDPHVERMIEAFAYLNARIRHKLDDDFPEITDAMLGVLYPHYQTPTPAMSVVQFQLSDDQGDLVDGYDVPRGTSVVASAFKGDTCRFKTCYNVKLWPMQLAGAAFEALPFEAPSTPKSPDAKAIVRLHLKALDSTIPISQFKCDRLRFYLHGDEGHNVQELYELLMKSTLEVALARSPTDNERVVLPASSIQPLGFSREEGMLPYSARSFLGYRLLTEYFAFPQKFCFFELTGLSPRKLREFGPDLYVYFYLTKRSREQERNVSSSTFRTGCSPIINLFKRRAEPIVLDEVATEYRVVADVRREATTEIYSINKVVATDRDGDMVEYQPFFAFKHAIAPEEQRRFYHSMRRPSGSVLDDVERGEGTEIYLTLLDLDFTPSIPAEWTLDVEVTCFNRDLPSELPFGSGQPHMEMPDGKGAIGAINCLVAPTKVQRPALKHRALWRLISHLNLNHLSLIDTEDGAHPLREILSLYDFRDSAETKAKIEGVRNIKAKRVVGRVGGIHGGFCRGIEIDLTLDETKFTGANAYLFATVLDKFFGMYTSMNSFTKLVATTEQRQGREEPWKWPPRTGEKILL